MYESQLAQGWATVRAIFVAPLVLCLVLTILWLPLGALGLLTGILFTLIFAPIAWVALIVAGVPLFWILYRLGVRGVWPVAACGLIAGAIAGIVAYDVLRLNRDPQLAFAVFGAIGGSIVAAIAWGMRRPDLDPV